MNAAETIQAAIDKLETLSRGAARPGPWDYAGQGWVRHGNPSVGSDQFPEVLAATTSTDADGVLIVTLHRTIDAQLAILQAHLRLITDLDYADLGVVNEDFEADYPDVLGLARAILGESS